MILSCNTIIYFVINYLTINVCKSTIMIDQDLRNQSIIINNNYQIFISYIKKKENSQMIFYNLAHYVN